MDTQVKELIETIKADGVEAAEKQAQQIIAAAEERAQQIVEDANKKADSVRSEAENDRKRQEAAGMEAIRQAGRDLMLGLQSEITALFKVAVSEQTREAMSGAALQKAIETVISAWAGNDDREISVLLPEQQHKELEGALRASLGGKLAAGAEVLPSAALKNGFRVATKGGEVYYDFSADAIAEALSAFLAPRLAEALREAAKGA